MSKKVYVHSFAAINARGIIDTKKTMPWNDDQRAVLDLRRDQVCAKPFPGFGKLQLPEKLSFGLAALMLNDEPALHMTQTGICLASTFGSFSTDCKYMDSVTAGFPSPAHFSATLPSSPVAEVAISFGLKGPNRVITGGNNPGIDALDVSVNALFNEKTDRMMVLVINAVDQTDTWSLSSYDHKRSEPYGYGFVLGTDRPKGDNRASIRLEGNYKPNDSNISSGESYLSAAIEALQSGIFKNIEVNTPDFMGYIVVNKEI